MESIQAFESWSKKYMNLKRSLPNGKASMHQVGGHEAPYLFFLNPLNPKNYRCIRNGKRRNDFRTAREKFAKKIDSDAILCSCGRPKRCACAFRFVLIERFGECFEVIVSENLRGQHLSSNKPVFFGLIIADWPSRWPSQTSESFIRQVCDLLWRSYFDWASRFCFQLTALFSPSFLALFHRTPVNYQINPT